MANIITEHSSLSKKVNLHTIGPFHEYFSLKNVMENLSVVIPDFKSKYLEKTIISSLLLGVEEIIISNYRTEYTDSLKKKFSYKKGIRFLDFHEKKNPGDYRNEGAEKVTKDFILFLDSDIEITEKTKF